VLRGSPGRRAALFLREVMNLTVFRAACFTIGHICYVDSSLAIELQNAYRIREKEKR
jgi:hypothetical protein